VDNPNYPFFLFTNQFHASTRDGAVFVIFFLIYKQVGDSLKRDLSFIIPWSGRTTGNTDGRLSAPAGGGPTAGVGCHHVKVDVEEGGGGVTQQGGREIYLWRAARGPGCHPSLTCPDRPPAGRPRGGAFLVMHHNGVITLAPDGLFPVHAAFSPSLSRSLSPSLSLPLALSLSHSLALWGCLFEASQFITDVGLLSWLALAWSLADSAWVRFPSVRSLLVGTIEQRCLTPTYVYKMGMT